MTNKCFLRMFFDCFPNHRPNLMNVLFFPNVDGQIRQLSCRLLILHPLLVIVAKELIRVTEFIYGSLPSGNPAIDYFRCNHFTAEECAHVLFRICFCSFRIESSVNAVFPTEGLATDNRSVACQPSVN